jgi:hypothetical protein
MKSQADLHSALIEDQMSLLGLSALNDLATFRSRVENKGLPFMAITLPQYAKDLERALATGSLTREGFFSFKRRGPADVRPLFLGGLMSLIFDADGKILPNPSTEAIRAVRQICLFQSKLKELAPPAALEAAEQSFVETDAAIADSPADNADYLAFSKVATRLWSVMFDKVLSKVETDFVPHHGPGAVADKLTSNGKYKSRSYSERLDRVLPASDWLIPGYGYYSELLESPFYAPAQEPPVRVVFVPKTMVTPRVIAIEPVYMQYIQQGFLSIFREEMAKNVFVSFEDQEPNRLLAKTGSIDGSLSTIDLSEASDRVSLRLVKAMLRHNTSLMEYVLACRSTRAELPNGDIILLKKFASMGSALTFPIESLVFFTIVVLAICEQEGLSAPTGKLIRSLRGVARVYGDDIIVPTRYTQSVITKLETFGLKVNVRKSFYEGNFRESCGAEYYSGSDVSIVRCRKRIPHNRQNVDELESFVALRNNYAEKYGVTKYVSMLDEHIEGIIPFPYGYSTTDALVRYDGEGVVRATGMHNDLHRPTVVACQIVRKYRLDKLEGSSALLKFFTTPFQEDREHLLRAGRPVSAKLKYRKVVL